MVRGRWAAKREWNGHGAVGESALGVGSVVRQRVVHPDLRIILFWTDMG